MPLPRTPASKKDLKKIKIEDLRQICQELGISPAGTKAELLLRIEQADPSRFEIAEEDVDDEHRAQEDKGIDPSKKDDPMTDGKPSEPVFSMNDMLVVMQEQMRMQQEVMQEQMRLQQAQVMELVKETMRETVRVSQENLHRHESQESVGESRDKILHRFDFHFDWAEKKMAALERTLIEGKSVEDCADAVASIKKSEEEIGTFLGKKSGFLTDEERRIIIRKFDGLSLKIREKHAEFVTLREKKREEKEKMNEKGYLPSGITPPEFDGNVLNYPVWWENFDTLVHSNKKVSVLFKYRYLRQSMKGTASLCLDGFSPLAEHYEAALAHVKDRYGQPRKIVRHVVKNIIDTPIMSQEPKALRKAFDKVSGKLHTLTQYIDKVKNPIDTLIIPILETKLPAELRQAWEKELIDKQGGEQFATVKLYKDWLTKEVAMREATLESPKMPGSADSKKDSSSTQYKPSSAQALPANAHGSSQDICQYCDVNTHKITECRRFKNASVDERWRVARTFWLCFRCFEDHHPQTTCRGKCEVDGCRTAGTHHSLLHYESTDATALNSSIPNRRNYSTIEIMPSAIVRIENDQGEESTIRVAFDTMSQSTFITEKAAKRMNLKFNRNVQLHVNGFGQNITKISTGRVHFGLSRPGSSEVYCIDALVKPGQICSPLDTFEVDWNNCPHLKGLDFVEQQGEVERDIDILIGLDHYLRLVGEKMVRHPTRNDVPAALETVFGYVLLGPTRNPMMKPRPSKKCLFVDTQFQEPTPLDKLVEKFWTLESIGITEKTRNWTSDERDAFNQLQDSIRFEEGRYCVKLPFKRDAPKLESNIEIAKEQLYSIERRLNKNEALKDDYRRAMNEYENLGFARKASEQEIREFENSDEYIVPHHPVVRPDKVTTKIRPVFNASLPDRNGNSLNSSLHPGPVLLPDLGQVLIRFRTNRIAIMADIQKMFCQTKIHPDHYRFQQYLWRDCNRLIEPQRYIMTSIMFGVGPSPFLSIGLTRYHADREDMKDQYPIACDTAKENTYVDDVCDGADTVEDARELTSQLKGFFRDGGWNLTKFVSNSQEVLQAIPETDRLIQDIVELSEKGNGNTKALGIGWNVCEDVFQFQLTDQLTAPVKRITKRNILSKVARIFDIFGFYAGFIIRGKIIVQQFWSLAKDWDEELSGKIVDEFRNWEKEIEHLPEVKIPRCLKMPHSEYVRLEAHGFSDASQLALGSIIYLLFIYPDGSVMTQFVLSKARVAPKATKSLARLELIGALMTARLMDYVTTALEQFKFESITLWTDSTVTLDWIAKPSSSWKIFVANRVQEIHDLVGSSVWRHVPGKDNPADLVSRGMTVEEIKSKNEYWHGPSWLQCDKSTWPSLKFDREPMDEEVVKEAVKLSTNVAASIIDPCVITTRIGNYQRMVRVVAWIMRWRYPANRTPESSLSIVELENAELTLIRQIQHRHFENETEALSHGHEIDRGSKLLPLDPKWDNEKRVIIVGGRLQYANIPEEAKHQIILPSKEAFTGKLIQHYHERAHHSAVETTFSNLRQKYWIIGGRKTVSSAIHQCLPCKHRSTKAMEQFMGPLPPERVRIEPAFTHIGVDFAGPLMIKNESKLEKTYICLFTCAQSRMIHLELVRNMETETFLEAFRRFVNRRGVPKTITSDNQSSFKKAAKIISDLKIQEYCKTRSIQWMNITERSPFRGGFYERLVASVKKPLKIVLGRALLKFDELYTVLTDIENAVNMRPLTFMSSNPKDAEAITPSHLALGRPLGVLPEMKGKDVKLGLRYKYVQRLFTHFWNRWSREFLQKMQTREKWNRRLPPIELNDVVLISEDNVPRNSWPLGRVVELLPGKDGLVRTARIQTMKGSYTRPVQRLHLYEKFRSSPEHDAEEEGPPSGTPDDAEEEGSPSGTPDDAEDEDFEGPPSGTPDATERDKKLRPERSQRGEDVVAPVRRSRYGRVLKNRIL